MWRVEGHWIARWSKTRLISNMMLLVSLGTVDQKVTSGYMTNEGRE